MMRRLTVCILIMAAPLFADTKGSIHGRVFDPTGAVIPGASLTLRNVSAGKTLTRSIDARLEVENLTNRIYPINLGSEFNGSHVSAPRQVTFRLGYRF
jgi:outer membrane receptor for ferric coprogen and ferric-rhodotorulic acid